MAAHLRIGIASEGSHLHPPLKQGVKGANSRTPVQHAVELSSRMPISAAYVAAMATTLKPAQSELVLGFYIKTGLYDSDFRYSFVRQARVIREEAA
jgi:hypothetical protein